MAISSLALGPETQTNFTFKVKGFINILTMHSVDLKYMINIVEKIF